MREKRRENKWAAVQCGKARERQQIHKSEGIISVKNIIFKYIWSQTRSRSSHQAPLYFFSLSPFFAAGAVLDYSLVCWKRKTEQ